MDSNLPQFLCQYLTQVLRQYLTLLSSQTAPQLAKVISKGNSSFDPKLKKSLNFSKQRVTCSLLLRSSVHCTIDLIYSSCAVLVRLQFLSPVDLWKPWSNHNHAQKSTLLRLILSAWASNSSFPAFTSVFSCGQELTGGQKFSPASSPAPTDAPTEVMTATDDSAPKRRMATADNPSKKTKTSSEKKTNTDKYLVMSSSDDGNQDNEIRYVSLAKFNELYENTKGFQRMRHALLRDLKNVIANASTTNDTAEELYETDRILDKSLTKDMTALNDVEVIVEGRKGNTE